MKYLYYLLLALAIGIAIFNTFYINLNAPFSGDSAIAIISIVGCLCVILLMVITLISLRIKAYKAKN